ncbi:MAG: LysR family transcriptional regulator [Alphaproteobacteria bacterium]|nr:LysR family transcriptional regulator [Alphaproteobacteria bacterium]
MRQADLNLLRSLDALLEERSVTKAARRVGLTQPALSAQLARLRAMFDDPLLVQVGKKLVPTDRATALRADLRNHLDGLNALVAKDDRFDPEASAIDFRIAASDALQHVVGAPFAAMLRRCAPKCRLAFFQAPATDVDQGLERGDIDLYIGTPSTLQDHWRQALFMHEEFVTAVDRGHKAAGRPLTLDEFRRADHLLVSLQGGGFEGFVDKVLTKRRMKRRVALSVQNFVLAPRFLEGSDLVATMPKRIAQAYGATLSIHPPPLEIPGFEVRMAWHPTRHATPANRWLRARALEAARAIG